MVEQKRERLFSRMLRAGKRTYFVDVEQTRSGERMLILTESHGKGVERYRIIVFQEDVPSFVAIVQEALALFRR
jgi:hypothetical protein